MRRDTIFRMASVTTPVTAAAAMILVEECWLWLDNPVEPWLPELADRQVLRRIEGTVPARRSITVRELLTFTFGSGMVAPQGTYPIQNAMRELGIGSDGTSPMHASADAPAGGAVAVPYIKCGMVGVQR